MTGKRVFCLLLLANLSVGVCETKIADSNPDAQNEPKAMLTVGCVNCGEYEYTDGRTSKATYAANWERLFSENPADIWFKEDAVESRDPNKCLEAVTARQPISNDIVTLIGTSPEGTTARRYARRLVYKVAGRRIAFYGLHLVAEAHISKEKGPDGKSPSQRLRQHQFAELIEDARRFDDAVFAGDFNAQEPWEYEIFKESDYVCANCSDRFGVEATLRDIPADNIIVSPGLRIEKFEVLKTPKLDTDHFPLVARLAVLARKVCEKPGSALVVPRTDWQKLNKQARIEARKLIRPGVPGKSPFWNARAKAFIHPPSFGFEKVVGAKKYRFTVIELLDGEQHVFFADGLKSARPQRYIVDGLPVKSLPNSTNVIKGDAKSLFIAAASILAKTARDEDCFRLEREYPGYGFAKHKGYPTPEHLKALAKLGPCPEHRRSFGPVMQMELGL